MVRLQTLDLRIGVQVPASQPFKLISWTYRKPKIMRTLALSSLLLCGGFTAFGQAPAELSDKAPAPVEEALRARVAKFYAAFIAGKFKDAYPLVADDSQDKFFEMSKNQYKECETVKIGYTDNFTQATVVESCKTEWHWHGTITPTVVPVTSDWQLVDGQWYWHYAKPKMMPSPFSPTGFVPVPQEDGKGAAVKAPVIPTDMRAAAQNIFAKVTVDKTVAHLKSDETSRDVIHVKNSMPGEISLSLDDLSGATPGLKATLSKTKLAANEETDLVIEYRLEDPGIACIDCAKKINGARTAQLRVQPTGQTFLIAVLFDHSAPASVPPSKPAKR